MSVSKTGISWCDATWNPVRGCSRVSEGCRHCYAERQAARFCKPGQPFDGYAGSRVHVDACGKESLRPYWTGKVELVPSTLDWPLRLRQSQVIFVNSMSDLFHEALPFTEVAKIFERMCWGFRLVCRKGDACRCECDHDAECYDPDNSGCHCWAEIPAHDYVMLTKRAARMREFFEWLGAVGPGGRSNAEAFAPSVAYTIAEADWPLPNVWLGVSVEDQATADERIPLLLQTPAAHRWVSAEPLLGPVDLARSRGRALEAGVGRESGHPWPPLIDAAIVGGESGPHARPCSVEWIRSIRDQCQAAKVPLFVKQLGSKPSGFTRGGAHVELMIAPTRGAGADPSEWPEDLRVRELAW